MVKSIAALNKKGFERVVIFPPEIFAEETELLFLFKEGIFSEIEESDGDLGKESELDEKFELDEELKIDLEK